MRRSVCGVHECGYRAPVNVACIVLGVGTHTIDRRGIAVDRAEIDRPEVKAEVEAVFARYEQALIHNDVDTLDAVFWADARTLRFGVNENLFGYEAIAEFRRMRPAQVLDRQLMRTVITTFGRDFATANTTFTRGTISGRQSQTWVRGMYGWQIVAAHVSLLTTPPVQAG